jgi:hypothetical protein
MSSSGSLSLKIGENNGILEYWDLGYWCVGIVVEIPGHLTIGWILNHDYPGCHSFGLDIKDLIWAITQDV